MNIVQNRFTIRSLKKWEKNPHLKGDSQKIRGSTMKHRLVFGALRGVPVRKGKQRPPNSEPQRRVAGWSGGKPAGVPL